MIFSVEGGVAAAGLGAVAVLTMRARAAGEVPAFPRT